ncbi:hypothetical protein AA103196_3025 [Ameyamaea chiangmaiensis NBRC 103196]|uniref:Uncharacterized protein n=1 Tax=Ameyamaea chiangmaiensis TaxID=442969 RepID=A0A850P3I1_9PROT|nr:hypothetical protein [Ameyamaea chiangmaiensis]MBS4074511.1 hypothetical protein [Ameyamaea chiangmaiensis]NVN39225.1 hypothetical protein [Ameyamaea chiangmaiensis]GBQ72315.1 hypothetical protein AA103196_3025 [Ameyamaea chiangmaiensis NBRC 103196]
MHDAHAPDGQLPPELSQCGEMVDRMIAHLLNEEMPPFAIASALLGGALGLLARTMDRDAMLRLLDNAARNVREGGLDPHADVPARTS